MSTFAHGRSAQSRPVAVPPPPSRRRGPRLRRLAGLIRKESLQMLRDPSSFMIAGVLPLLLLFIFGFGVTLDLRRVPIAVVVEWPSPEADSFSGLVPQLALFRRAIRAAPQGRRARPGLRKAQRDRRRWRPTSATGSAAARQPRSRCSWTAATPTPPAWSRITSRACGRTGSSRKRPPETRW